MEKTNAIYRLILVLTVIGFILLILTLLSIFSIINMDSMLFILLSSGIFSIVNGYSVYINGKKGKITFLIVTIAIVAGFFSIFVAIFKTFF